ncbi:hypothetical protein CLOM_g12762 [Closterium sp. NIES-68]|nr:hypothetical protein CLOM_g12762 [Closterium sp. NIES-68]
MALFQYHKARSSPSRGDQAVEELCNTGTAASTPVKEINGAVIGVYGQCLVSQKRNRLPEDCRTLVKLVAKEGAYVGGTIDQNKLEETLAKLKELQEAAATTAGGGGMVVRHDTGLVISGGSQLLLWPLWWLFSIAIGCAVYYKYFSPTRNYTLVVKSAPGATGV